MDPSQEKFSFFHTGEECAKDYGVTAPGAAIIRNFDTSPVVYTEGSMSAWMDSNSVPILFEFSDDYIESIFGKRNAAIILFTDDKESDHMKAFAAAANDMQGTILFGHSGVSGGIQERLAEFIGVGAADMPTLRILHPGEQMNKYQFDKDVATVTTDDVKNWVNEWKNGNLTPHRKSEPIPESNDGPVKTLVGLNFEDIVMDPTKDVFVKYYAPWCGHCKTLAPKWEELGTHVAGSDLVIAKFDATANEHEMVEVKGYPTLKFYPKDNKKGVDYGEGRELEDLKKWLGENSEAWKSHFAGKSEDL